jgi:hypothetical protein
MCWFFVRIGITPFAVRNCAIQIGFAAGIVRRHTA